MKVKVRDKWYSTEDEPICIQVSEGEQEQIANLDRSLAPKGKYALFPENCNLNQAEMIEWMRDEDDS